MPTSPAMNLPPIQIDESFTSSRRGLGLKGRHRSNSLLKVEYVGETQEEVLDQSMYVNLNVEWINRKGAWLMHPLLIFMGKGMIDSVPGMSPQVSWTSVNLLYNALTYLIFHAVTGIPFQSELHSGAYDDLTLWEQIDDGAQYTPAKKWLLCVPITLFLLSTHYTHYDPWIFAINITALVFNLLPKLPMFHHKRLRFMPDEPASTASTPLSGSFPPSRVPTPDNTELPPSRKNN